MPGSTLNVANSATSLPMTGGSFVEVQLAPGQNSLAFSIPNTTTYSGQLQVAVSLDGQTFEKVSNSSIDQVNGTTGLSANATGQYEVAVSGLFAFVYLESYTSGSPVVTAVAGPGAGTTGQSGGSSVTVTNSNQGYPSAPTETTPTVNNATSTQILAAGTYTNIVIQNNLATNIMVSFTGATLTGIVPTSTNIGLVLFPGSTWQEAPNGVTTDAITCYQTSGSATNAIYVRVK